MIKRIKYYILLTAFIAGCANIQAPSGGPEDKEPPSITETVPVSGTTMFKSKKIKIRFSEYINKSSFAQSLSFQPEIKKEIDWDGTTVNIEIKEELKPDITYLLSLGTDYKDLRNNKPAQSFSLIFTPGGKIDSGKISGRVYGDKIQGKFIFAYKKDNVPEDSLNPAKVKPDYKVQLGSNGTFTIMALKDGEYRLFCIDDMNKNDLFDINSEAITTTCEDVTVFESVSKPVTMNTPGYIDLQKPKIYSARSVDLFRVWVSTSEPVAETSLSPGSFLITDSLSGKEHKIKFAYLTPREENTITLIPELPLDSGRTYTVRGLDEFPIRDTTGNVLSDTMRTASFIGTKSRKEIIPRLIAMPFKDSTENVPLKETFEFEFNTAVITDDLEATIEFFTSEDSSSTGKNIELVNSRKLRIKPEAGLKPNTWHTIKLHAYMYKAFNDSLMRDSVKIINFKTLDPRSYGGMKGKILVEYPGEIILNAIHKKSGKSFNTKVNENSEWSFPSVPPGKYSFTAFRDNNGNGRYDYGYPFPYEHTECFYFIDREIEVKARWTIDEIFIKVDNEK